MRRLEVGAVGRRGMVGLGGGIVSLKGAEGGPPGVMGFRRLVRDVGRADGAECNCGVCATMIGKWTGSGVFCSDGYSMYWVGRR